MTEPHTSVRRRIGPAGVWLAPQMLLPTTPEARRGAARRIERLGYGSIWLGEPPTGFPDVFERLTEILDATRTVTVGSGIANLTLRDPAEMRRSASRIARAHPGRLIAGIGGPAGTRPLGRTRDYLRDMTADGEPYPRVLAALGPKMLGLAAEHTDGAHPFMMPVENTARARTILGPDRLLIPQQFVLLESDPRRARDTLRSMLGSAMGDTAPSGYADNFRRLGYTDDDLAAGPSDRLVDAVLAHGAPDAVAARVTAHLDAGADHVLLTPLAAGLPATVDALERLAPSLLAPPEEP